MTDIPPPPLRIAGVREAFNDPFATATFDIPTTFIAHPGGSGAMLNSLNTGTVDAAFMLTDCAIAAIARGSAIRLLAPVIDSPLTWGVVSRAGTVGLSALTGARWAISRIGSGSDVMLRVLAAREKWPDVNRRVFGTFSGMANAVRDGEADAFLWETHTTRGLFRRGEGEGLAVVGEIQTPWPAFCCVVRNDCRRVAEVARAVGRFLEAGRAFKGDAGSVDGICERHGMTKEDARAWVGAVVYAPAGGRIDAEVVRATLGTLVTAGVVEGREFEFKISDFVVFENTSKKE